MPDRSLPQMGLEAIIRACREESALKVRHSGWGDCFELFRRALEHQDEAALVAIYQQYRDLMLIWVAQHSTNLRPDLSEWITDKALQRFQHTNGHLTGPLITHFPHVGALLNFLKRCVISQLIDYRRQAERLERYKIELLKSYNNSEPEELALTQVELEELAQRLRAWIQRNVTDPQEDLVIRLSFVEDLTPAQIAQRYPDQFSDARQVSRIKENVLKRARRNPWIKTLSEWR